MKSLSLICLAMAAILSLANAAIPRGRLPRVSAMAHRPLFIPKPIPASKGPPADVVFACSIAKDKQFCVQTLSANPEAKGADLPKLVSLALQLARSKGMEISDSLDDLLQDEQKLPQDLDEALNDCSDQFSEALAQLEDTTNGLTSDPVPFNDMRSWLAAALNNAEVCQRGMLDVNPLNLRASASLPNDLFAKLCDTSLSVVTVMQIEALKTGQAATLS